MIYVAMDIGCIECGEISSCLGVFTDESTAQSVCDQHEQEQARNWHGEHRFTVFELEELNKEFAVKYT